MSFTPPPISLPPLSSSSIYSLPPCLRSGPSSHGRRLSAHDRHLYVLCSSSLSGRLLSLLFQVLGFDGKNPKKNLPGFNLSTHKRGIIFNEFDIVTTKLYGRGMWRSLRILNQIPSHILYILIMVSVKNRGLYVKKCSIGAIIADVLENADTNRVIMVYINPL